MNAPHEEAMEFAKVSKRENRVYVGNLSYDVRYRDLMEFMRGGGWGNPRLAFSHKRTVFSRATVSWRAESCWCFFVLGSGYAQAATAAVVWRRI